MMQVTGPAQHLSQGGESLRKTGTLGTDGLPQEGVDGTPLRADERHGPAYRLRPVADPVLVDHHQRHRVQDVVAAAARQVRAGAVGGGRGELRLLDGEQTEGEREGR